MRGCEVLTLLSWGVLFKPDWVQDTLLERTRRQKETEASTRTVGHSMRAVFWRIVDSGQSWFVVSLVGKWNLP